MHEIRKGFVLKYGDYLSNLKKIDCPLMEIDLNEEDIPKIEKFLKIKKKGVIIPIFFTQKNQKIIAIAKRECEDIEFPKKILYLPTGDIINYQELLNLI